MSVHKKLMEARIKLQAADMKKSGLNKFAGYQYFELGDFLPIIERIFSELGLCGIVSYAPDIATLTITDTDGGGSVSITSPMAEANLKGCHPIQNLGAVETYTRRYLWVTALEIVEHDAIDSSEPKNEPKVKGSKSSASDGALESLEKHNPERHAFVLSLCESVVEMAKDEVYGIQNAYLAIQDAKLDTDEKVALNEALKPYSTIRSGLASYIRSL